MKTLTTFCYKYIYNKDESVQACLDDPDLVRKVHLVDESTLRLELEQKRKELKAKVSIVI